ncbi:MAG: hypothetical protein Q4E57_06955 [Eubacteriales bacterium]|nr:hypothetical protein [Eubacteriales bacterium]
MAEKDLLEIIARMTAHSIQEVSKIYYEQNPAGRQSASDNSCKNGTGNGFPFGTPLPHPRSIVDDDCSITKSLDELIRKHHNRKE